MRSPSEDFERPLTSLTETETLSATHNHRHDDSFKAAVVSRTPLVDIDKDGAAAGGLFSRSTTANSKEALKERESVAGAELLESPQDMVIENRGALDKSPKKETIADESQVSLLHSSFNL